MSGDKSLEEVEVDIKKAVRMLLKEGVKFVPSQLMKRNEILFAVSRAKVPISSESLKLMLYPFIDCRDWIWNEYRERDTWTIGEAASLSVGMDPVIFNYEKEGYNNDWREARYQHESKIYDAVHLGRVEVIRDDMGTYLVKDGFLIWALESGLLEMGFAEPLKKYALKLVNRDSSGESNSIGIGVRRARFSEHAHQSYISNSLSSAQVRKNTLFEFAVLLKIEEPGRTREKIAREIWLSLPEDYRSLSGFNHKTIRSDLHGFDKSIEHPTHRALEFLNSVPSNKEIESSDPTHRWWVQWRPVIARKLPLLVLPE